MFQDMRTLKDEFKKVLCIYEEPVEAVDINLILPFPPACRNGTPLPWKNEASILIRGGEYFSIMTFSCLLFSRSRSLILIQLVLVVKLCKWFFQVTQMCIYIHTNELDRYS